MKAGDEKSHGSNKEGVISGNVRKKGITRTNKLPKSTAEVWKGVRGSQ